MRSNGHLPWMLLLAGPVAAQTTYPAPPTPERRMLLQRAAADLAAGRRAEAAARLREAADRFRSVRALLQLAELQSSGGDPRGALDSLARARAAAPNSEAVLVAFAEASLAVGASLPAVSALEPLTRMSPNVAQHHLILGRALIRAGDLQAAATVLRRAERLEPAKASTLIALGVALIGHDLYAQAEPYLLRGLELEPDDADATAALAECEVSLGDLSSAEIHARRVLARSPAHAVANLALGMVLLARERPVEARGVLDKAAAANPGSAKIHHQLALTCAALNDQASARRYEDDARRRAEENEALVAKLRSEVGNLATDEP